MWCRHHVNSWYVASHHHLFASHPSLHRLNSSHAVNHPFASCSSSFVLTFCLSFCSHIPSPHHMRIFTFPHVRSSHNLFVCFISPAFVNPCFISARMCHLLISTFCVFQFFHICSYIYVIPYVSLNPVHWNGMVVRVTALIFTGDVEGKLQRLQWIIRAVTLTTFPFLWYIIAFLLVARYLGNHWVKLLTERST